MPLARARRRSLWLVEDAWVLVRSWMVVDRTVANTEVFVDHLDHRRQAIGGASRRHDPVHGRVKQLLIDPITTFNALLLSLARRHHHALNA